jgi:hypothetical protein
MQHKHNWYSNLLWSLTAYFDPIAVYLDLALIFLLFRFSLRIRFFLHWKTTENSILSGDTHNMPTPSQKWGLIPGQIFVPQQKVAVQLVILSTSGKPLWITHFGVW